jgi:mevalonate kinase
VNIYQQKIKDPEFKNSCANILSREVNFAIDDVLSGADSKNLFHHMWLISKFQWEYFQEMIPMQFKEIWEKGLDSGEYVLKLCGAGGGGFILGYSYSRYESHLLPALEKFELRNMV